MCVKTAVNCTYLWIRGDFSLYCVIKARSKRPLKRLPQDTETTQDKAPASAAFHVCSQG